MIRMGIATVALVACGAMSGAFAGDTKGAGLTATGGTAAMAELKSDSTLGGGLGKDASTAQLGSQALGASAIGSGIKVGNTALSSVPDEGSSKKGLLNSRHLAATLAGDEPHGFVKSSSTSLDTAQSPGGHDLMK